MVRSSLALLPLLVACSDDKCETDPFEGTLVFSEDTATGQVSGTASWPASVEEGSVIDFGLVGADGTGYLAAISDGGLLDFTGTCGTETTFTIKGVASGNYRVFAGIQTGDGADTGAIDYIVQGRSDVITIHGTVSDVPIVLE